MIPSYGGVEPPKYAAIAIREVIGGKMLVMIDENYPNPIRKTREEKLQWLKQFAKHA